MAYVGNPIDTQNTFQSLQGKRFSGDESETEFTLDIAPSSTLDIEVFVGNVRQDPNSAYTLSGTTLTFTGAPPSGTNNIYVVHQAKSVGTIDVPSSYKSDAQTISGARTHSGAITANAGITMGGTTPTLTIGDAGAEDAKIVFDGNAQDYYVGLDDTDDELKIGLGSALGTTSYIVIDANGHVRKPFQPFFAANASYTNIPLTTSQTITLSERVDTNGDLASNTFTAPVTGKYYLGYHFYLTSLDADHTALDVKIVTSNKTYAVTYKPSVTFSADANFGVTGSQICDMDAGDTATFVIYIASGSAQTDVHADSTASGMLIG